MGETLPLFPTSFNRSVQIESRPDHLTGDAGALVQREIMERTGVIDWLTARLHDPRNQDLITYPLSDLLRTHLLLPHGRADGCAQTGTLVRHAAENQMPRHDDDPGGSHRDGCTPKQRDAVPAQPAGL